MRFRIGSAIASLALAISMTAVAMAQADGDTHTTDDAVPAETAAAPGVDQSSVAPMLFLQLIDPDEQDVEVPLETDHLTVHGATIPGTVVSIDGELVDTDDQGSFAGVAALEEGANVIDVVASDNDGNQLSTTLYVVRGN